MKLSFTKMNGAGNDFVMLDNRAGALTLSRAQLVWLCDRHRGIGADGVLLVERASSNQADFRMRYYNADGGEAEMCGNGARCFARFTQKIGGYQNHVCFETLAGIIQAEISDGKVRISLGLPHSLKLREHLKLSSGEVEVHSINTGVPHAVLVVSDANQALVSSLGKEVRFHSHFAPKGANVNFVQKLKANIIRVRTYERGVEAETLACGTGVVASALILHRLFEIPSPIQVVVQGGDMLEVSFRKLGDEFQDVFLTGPADFVFDGALEI